MPRRLAIIAIVIVLAAACSRGPSELKPIQQQRSGDYIVTLLNDTGTLKQRKDRLRLEFRNASDNQLANVSNVHIQASMLMPGMGPMFGNVSTPDQKGPGQYDLDAEFSMAGQWNFVVTFDPNGRVQFNPRAQ